jgi:hypothetical protein
VAAEIAQQVARLGMAVVHGVEEVDREGDDIRERSSVDRRDGVQAVAGGTFQPWVCGDGWVAGCDAVRSGRDHRGDLQRRHGRVGSRPPWSRSRGHAEGQRHRQAAVGQRHRVQPLAQGHGLGRGRRRDVLESLEGVQRRARLALRRAQIGLQAPAVAAVVVAITVQGREHTRGVGVPVEQLEAAAVEDPRVGGHEVPCQGEVDGHAADAPPSATPCLERNGSAARGQRRAGGWASRRINPRARRRCLRAVATRGGLA